MQSNKTNNPPKPAVARLIPPQKRRLEAAWPRLDTAPQIPCTTAPLRQKAQCSGQQVKNNLETHITQERVQGQEAGGARTPGAPER